MEQRGRAGGAAQLRGEAASLQAGAQGLHAQRCRAAGASACSVTLAALVRATLEEGWGAALWIGGVRRARWVGGWAAKGGRRDGSAPLQGLLHAE